MLEELKKIYKFGERKAGDDATTLSNLSGAAAYDRQPSFRG